MRTFLEALAVTGLVALTMGGCYAASVLSAGVWG